MFDGASMLKPTEVIVKKKDVYLRVTRRFAYLPRRLTNRNFFWFGTYFVIERIYNGRIIHHWTTKYDSQEYLARKLADTL